MYKSCVRPTWYYRGFAVTSEAITSVGDTPALSGDANLHRDPQSSVDTSSNRKHQESGVNSGCRCTSREMSTGGGPLRLVRIREHRPKPTKGCNPCRYLFLGSTCTYPQLDLTSRAELNDYHVTGRIQNAAVASLLAENAMAAFFHQNLCRHLQQRLCYANLFP